MQSEKAGDQTTKDLARVMFESAVLRSGFALQDSAGFATRIERMLRLSLGVDVDAPVSGPHRLTHTHTHTHTLAVYTHTHTHFKVTFHLPFLQVSKEFGSDEVDDDDDDEEDGEEEVPVELPDDTVHAKPVVCRLATHTPVITCLALCLYSLKMTHTRKRSCDRDSTFDACCV